MRRRCAETEEKMIENTRRDSRCVNSRRADRWWLESAHAHVHTHTCAHTRSMAETLHSAQQDSEYSHQAVTEVKMTGGKKACRSQSANMVIP